MADQTSGSESVEEYIAEIFGEEVPGYNVKSFKWTHPSIKLLITERLSMEKNFEKPSCKKNKLWSIIASKLKETGKYNVTGLACHEKYRNMLQTYKRNKEKQKQSGSEGINWEYFELFDSMLCHKAAINPNPATISDYQEGSENNLEEDIVAPPTKKGRSNNWKAEYFRDKIKLKTLDIERKRQQWTQRKELETERTDAIRGLIAALREFNSIKERESI